MKWFNEGNEFFQKEQYDQAIKCWEKALEIGKEEKNDQVIAKSLMNIGTAYSVKEDWNNALKFFHQALKVEQKRGEDSTIAECLMNIGDTFFALENWESAQIYYKQSLELFLESDRNKARILLNIGLALFAEGNWTAAAEYYEQSFEVFKELGDLEGVSRVLANLGIAARNMGRWEKAIQYYKQSIEIDKKADDKAGSAVGFMNIGIALEMLGRPKESIEHYQKSLGTFKELEDEKGVASCLLNLGNAFEMLRKWDKAQEFYQQSLKKFEKLEDQSNVSKCLTNIGITLRNLGQWEEAIKNYKKSLKWFESVNDQAAISKCLLDLGVAYYSVDKWEEAVKFYEDSRKLFQNLGDRPGEALACQNLGWGYQKHGEKQLALKYFTEALGIYTTLVTRINTEEYRESYMKKFEDLPKIIDNINQMLEQPLEINESAPIGEIEKGTNLMNDLLSQLRTNITELNSAVKSQTGSQDISKNISGLMKLVNRTMATFSESEKIKSEKLSKGIFESIDTCKSLFNLIQWSKPGEKSSNFLKKLEQIQSRINEKFPELDLNNEIQDHIGQLKEEPEKLTETNVINLKFAILSWIKRLISIAITSRKLYIENVGEGDTETTQKLEAELNALSNHLAQEEKNFSHQILGYLIITKIKSGIPIYRMHFIEATFDADLVGGFLSAIQSFGSEITKEKTSMEKLAYKNFTINFQDGKYIRCALILKGEMTDMLSKRLKHYVSEFEEKFQDILSTETGNITAFEKSDPLVKKFFSFNS